jgi:hypothetical protein
MGPEPWVVVEPCAAADVDDPPEVEEEEEVEAEEEVEEEDELDEVVELEVVLLEIEVADVVVVEVPVLDVVVVEIEVEVEVEVKRRRRAEGRGGRRCTGRSSSRSGGRGGRGACSRLEDLDVVNLPVSVLVIAGVVGHIIDTALDRVTGVLHRASRGSKESARPVATESGVEDESLVMEGGAKIAVPLEVTHWFSKLADVGMAVLDAGWDGAARPEPDLDCLRCPLHRVHTTFNVVEARSKGGWAT